MVLGMRVNGSAIEMSDRVLGSSEGTRAVKVKLVDARTFSPPFYTDRHSVYGGAWRR